MISGDTKPLVSIVTVVFNGAKTIEQTFKSVLNQSYSEIEYIVVDGGSTDGTQEIIANYKGLISRWISEPDEGLYDAMNKGIGMSNGDLIGIINSDDWYEVDAVETMVKVYLAEPNKYIFHGDLRIHGEGESIRVKYFNPSRFKMKYYGVTYNHPTFFVRREVYQRFMFNTSLVSVADIQFILQVLNWRPNAFEYVPKIIANFRKGGISSQQSTIASIISGYLARRNAGFKWYENYFSVIIKVIYHSVTTFITAESFNKIKRLLYGGKNGKTA